MSSSGGEFADGVVLGGVCTLVVVMIIAAVLVVTSGTVLISARTGGYTISDRLTQTKYVTTSPEQACEVFTEILEARQ